MRVTCLKSYGFGQTGEGNIGNWDLASGVFSLLSLDIPIPGYIVSKKVQTRDCYIEVLLYFLLLA
jgi:hypothetical protein